MIRWKVKKSDIEQKVLSRMRSTRPKQTYLKFNPVAIAIDQIGELKNALLYVK